MLFRVAYTYEQNTYKMNINWIVNPTIMNYEAVIGLEFHLQLKTKTKAFCACSTEFGKSRIPDLPGMFRFSRGASGF